jgi:microcystin-dependent protein
MDPLVGTIQAMAFRQVPRGWAACDGSICPGQQNGALLALIGGIYGGDGWNTYGLPDLRGRMALGQGQGPGLSPRLVGQHNGLEAVTLTTSQLPPHEHPVSLGPSTAAPGSAGTMAAAGSGAVTPMPSGVTGSGLPIETMPPTLVVTFQIAIAGSFPEWN